MFKCIYLSDVRKFHSLSEEKLFLYSFFSSMVWNTRRTWTVVLNSESYSVFPVVQWTLLSLEMGEHFYDPFKSYKNISILTRAFIILLLRKFYFLSSYRSALVVILFQWTMDCAKCKPVAFRVLFVSGWPIWDLICNANFHKHLKNWTFI